MHRRLVIKVSGKGLFCRRMPWPAPIMAPAHSTMPHANPIRINLNRPAVERGDLLRWLATQPGRWVADRRACDALQMDMPALRELTASLIAEGLVRRRFGFRLVLTPAGREAVATPSTPPPAPAPEPAAKAPEISPMPPSSGLGRTLLGGSPELPGPSEVSVPLPEAPATVAESDDDLRMLCAAIGLNPGELDLPAGPPRAELSAVPERSAPILLRILPGDPARIAAILHSLRSDLPRLGLTRDDEAEAAAEIATTTAQLLSPRPKPVIVAASLGALLGVLDAAGPRLLPATRASLTEIRLFLTQIEAHAGR